LTAYKYYSPTNNFYIGGQQVKHLEVNGDEACYLKVNDDTTYEKHKFEYANDSGYRTHNVVYSVSEAMAANEIAYGYVNYSCANHSSHKIKVLIPSAVLYSNVGLNNNTGATTDQISFWPNINTILNDNFASKVQFGEDITLVYTATGAATEGSYTWNGNSYTHMRHYSALSSGASIGKLILYDVNADIYSEYPYITATNPKGYAKCVGLYDHYVTNTDDSKTYYTGHYIDCNADRYMSNNINFPDDLTTITAFGANVYVNIGLGYFQFGSMNIYSNTESDLRTYYKQSIPKGNYTFTSGSSLAYIGFNDICGATTN
jgi:hypothetical protein